VADGNDLQQVLRHEALRVAHAGLIAGIERGFSESFQFKAVPAYTKSDVDVDLEPDSVREPFDIQITPVTQGQLMVWRYATGALDPAHLPAFRGLLGDGTPDHVDHIDLGDGITMNYDHPGENMSFFEAEAMAAWLTDLPASKAAGCSYSVITEPQYLHALHWAFGEEWDGTERVKFLTDAMVKAHAVYDGNRNGEHTMAVSERDPSPQGLRHMVGNVNAWTKTKLVFSWGYCRVIRGGCYLDVGTFPRSASRSSRDPSTRRSDLGFRLVRHCL
jgi:formylglycine-generating enzyme required for sulfatase activity